MTTPGGSGKFFRFGQGSPEGFIREHVFTCGNCLHQWFVVEAVYEAVVDDVDVKPIDRSFQMITHEIGVEYVSHCFESIDISSVNPKNDGNRRSFYNFRFRTDFCQGASVSVSHSSCTKDEKCDGVVGHCGSPEWDGTKFT